MQLWLKQCAVVTLSFFFFPPPPPLQVLSVGLNDSLSSQVDVKGKVGAASLKENVCQVSVNAMFFFFAFCCRWHYVL